MVFLNGSGSTDPDGTIVKYLWSQIGTTPSLCVITRPDSAKASVVPSGNQQWLVGTYKFKLTVTDNSGASSSDTVQINILPNPNKAPKADAGTDQTITLPVNQVAIGGADQGQNLTISWTKVSGGTAFIKSPSAPVTTVTGLQRGSYTFQKLVQNDLGTSRDLVNVTVKKKCSWLASIFGCK